MKIGILGTRGIPNNYGGFEQCAQYVGKWLAEKGHQVFVYNSHNHPYQSDSWEGISIIHCHDPEKKLGTFGQFIYDLNCIRDARKRNFDVVLQLGYTSSAVWSFLWPAVPTLVNMDGLEWKRSKYSGVVQMFLKRSEHWAAKSATLLIADSPGISEYLLNQYNKQSEYIAYGAEIFRDPDFRKVQENEIFRSADLEPYQYDLLIARFEPENNIETILKAYTAVQDSKKLVLAGNYRNGFGKKLISKYGGNPQLLFVGPLYNKEILDNLRFHSSLYFHGHSVGGTNPSLLEAMACSSLIVAHDNTFNRHVLGEDAAYFRDENDLKQLIPNFRVTGKRDEYTGRNLGKISEYYNWEMIAGRYEEAMKKALQG